MRVSKLHAEKYTNDFSYGMFNFTLNGPTAGGYSQEPVDSYDEGDVISRQSNGGQHDDHGDQTSLGNASCSNASSSSSYTGQRNKPRTVSFKQMSHKLVVEMILCHPQTHLPDSNDLTKVHLHVVDLSDEDGRQSLVECRPVHVNGGANRQNKSGDSLVNSVVLLQTFEGDGECGRTVV